jgi:hypothetical protein
MKYPGCQSNGEPWQIEPTTLDRVVQRSHMVRRLYLMGEKPASITEAEYRLSRQVSGHPEGPRG